MQINDTPIGPDHPPFVIAEMSGNHNQSLDRALSIVDAASDAGAHALKIQTYTPDTMTLDLDRDEFRISDPSSPWKGESLFALYGKAYTPWEWHSPIFERAKERGLIALSSPFDATAVDLLEDLDAPAYKIASFEITDLPLVRRVAATGKPVIISTGMASVAEIDDAVRAARGVGCDQIVLLKCTSTYPASPVATNIRTIPHLREMFGCEAGLSDHTMGVGVAVASVALGASVIEKHFTLRRADGGPDSTFSLEPDEFSALVTETRRAWEALGEISYGPTCAEEKSLQFRRSLYFVQDVRAGDTLSPDNVRAIRPGLGLSPKYLDYIVGMRARVDVRRGTPLAWQLVG